LVVDVQRVKTIMMRTTADNIYATQYARPVLGQGHTSDTLTDLMNPAQGAPIRLGDINQFRWDMPPSVAQATLPMIELMDTVKENRTGVTRYNQGLDANSLNKTASGIQRIMSAAQKKIMAVARTYKETGIRNLYFKVHQDMRRGPGKQLTLKIRGKWIQTDPREWRERKDLVVSGTADKEVKQQGLMWIAGMQEKMAAAGVPMVGMQEMYETAQRTTQSFGFKSAAPFFKDPASIPPAPPQPPPPDPMMFAAETDRMKAQADVQHMQAKTQVETQLANEQHMFNVAKFNADHEYRMKQLSLEEAKAVGNMVATHEKQDLERDKAEAQDDREREQMAIDATLTISAQEQAAIAAQQANELDPKNDEPDGGTRF
jgi:hypothetical protein